MTINEVAELANDAERFPGHQRRPISEAPVDGSVQIVTSEHGTAAAPAFFREGSWRLGRPEFGGEEAVPFNPTWWMRPS